MRSYWSLALFAVPLAISSVAMTHWGWRELHNVDADTVREKQAAEFNDVVRQWNKTVRNEWSKVQSVQLHDWFSGQDPLQGVVLEPDTTEDPAHKLLVTGEGLSGYVPLRYTYRGKVSVSEDGSVSPWADLSASLGFTTGRQSRHRLLTTDLTLSGSHTVRTSNWKHCFHQLKGSLDQASGVCTVYKKLSKMCFKLRLSRDGDGPPTWGPRSEKGVDGCDVDTDSEHPSVAYKIAKALRYQSTPPGPKQVSLDDVSIVARADGDPLLAAQRIARKRFAPSRRDREAVAKLQLGGGLALFLLLVLLTWMWISEAGCFETETLPKSRSSRERHTTQVRRFRRLSQVDDDAEGCGGSAPRTAPRRQPGYPGERVVELRQNARGYSSQ